MVSVSASALLPGWARRPAMKRADESVTAVPQQPALLRWSYAAGSFGIWGPLVAFALHRTGAYVIYLGADATAIGTIGIIDDIPDTEFVGGLFILFILVIALPLEVFAE